MPLVRYLACALSRLTKIRCGSMRTKCPQNHNTRSAVLYFGVKPRFYPHTNRIKHPFSPFGQQQTLGQRFASEVVE